jgi:hypothetical protein
MKSGLRKKQNTLEKLKQRNDIYECQGMHQTKQN